MVCSHCTHENRAEARFCANCGQPLPAPPARPDTCQHCGQALRSAARFCPRCGQPTADAAGPGVTCAYCRTVNPPGTVYCKQCAAELKTLPCPSCLRPNRPTARHCAHCGSALLIQEDEAGPLLPNYQTGSLPPRYLLNGRYLIVDQIARGGMGAIYLASDPHYPGQRWAVKEMSLLALQSLSRLDQTAIVDGFTREHELLSTLVHPNLPRAADFFQIEGRYYMVLEYLEGRTLETILDQTSGFLAEERVVTWARQLCDVLFFLHNQTPAIVYRDLKPSNIMEVSNQTHQIKLFDFGISRFHKPGGHSDTIRLGTLGYAPPEQFGRSQTDARSDIYALGATLHQLLTGLDPTQRPFDFPPVRRINPHVSARVETAIMRAVDPDVGMRPQDAEAMLKALSGKDAQISIPVFSPAASVPGFGWLFAPLPLVQLGPVPRGQVATSTINLRLRRAAEVEVVADQPWLRASCETSGDSGDWPLDLEARTRQLPLGRYPGPAGLRPDNDLTRLPSPFRGWVLWHARWLVPGEKAHRGKVIVTERDTGASQGIDVELLLQPDEGRRQLGWVLVSASLAAEVGALLITGLLGLALAVLR